MNGHAQALYPGDLTPRHSSMHRFIHWLLGLWSNECHRFEEPDRFEPYY